MLSKISFGRDYKIGPGSRFLDHPWPLHVLKIHDNTTLSSDLPKEC